MHRRTPQATPHVQVPPTVADRLHEQLTTVPFFRPRVLAGIEPTDRADTFRVLLWVETDDPYGFRRVMQHAHTLWIGERRVALSWDGTSSDVMCDGWFMTTFAARVETNIPTTDGEPDDEPDSDTFTLSEPGSAWIH